MTKPTLDPYLTPSQRKHLKYNREYEKKRPHTHLFPLLVAVPKRYWLDMEKKLLKLTGGRPLDDFKWEVRCLRAGFDAVVVAWAFSKDMKEMLGPKTWTYKER